jgi:beta-galactosidase
MERNMVTRWLKHESSKQLFTKKTSLLVLLGLAFTTINASANKPSSETKPEWQNPEIYRVNKLPARAFYYPVQDADNAFTNTPWELPNYQLLNGLWKFNWVNSPKRAPVGFASNDYDDSKWDEISVPANWEVNGYGTPFYHSHYCFSPNAKPPELPLTYNPVGSYRKTITIDESWAKQRIIVHFGAVKSAFYLYVNGKQVGYSEDSKTAAEFDLTDYLNTGENTLALKVHRYSTGSYFECQDMWRVSGIERDVFLFTQPKVHISDVYARTDLSSDYSKGVLDLRVDVSNSASNNAADYALFATLTSAAGEQILSKRLPIKTLKSGKTVTLTHFEELSNVLQWSAETPHLYKLSLALVSSSDDAIEHVGQHIGFRSTELKNGNILINGKAVLFKGVNRHEHDPVTAHVVSRESMRKDLELMKAFNINAIRMAHYPSDPYIYYLADKYGFYVMDEANIESHGVGAANQGWSYDPSTHLVNKPEWKGAYIDRVSNMYHRTKNHPSVVMRSLGNESGDGVNLEAIYDWLKLRDPKFPVVSEQAQLRRHTDVYGQMYAPIEHIERYVKVKQDVTRPVILIEYQHAMGNSLGNFADYWDTFEKYPQLQGGFIWDWVDQTFAMETADGRNFWAYGGDLEPPMSITAKSFSANGLVYADRTPYPYLWEVKKAQQNIGFDWADISEREVKVSNKHFFAGLSAYSLRWDLLADGKVVESKGGLSLSSAAQRNEVMALAIATEPAAGVEYFVNLYAILNDATNLLPKGHIVASEQLSLPNIAMKSNNKSKSKSRISQSKTQLSLSTSDIKLTISKTSGLVTALEVNGDNLLLQAAVPNFWRAPIDNDFSQAGYGDKFGVWQHAGSTMQLTSLKIEDDSTTVVTEHYIRAVESRLFTTYSVTRSGEIDVDVYFYAAPHKRQSALPRLGTQFVLNNNYKQVHWYGRGPHENYTDRKDSAFVGRYASSVSDLYEPYVRPQENGHRSDVRRVAFVNDKGKGIEFVGAPLIGFNASHTNMHDYDASSQQVSKRNMHPTDLPQYDKVFVNIDLAQRGVGGTDSWGAKPLFEYTLPWLDYRYQYKIRAQK